MSAHEYKQSAHCIKSAKFFSTFNEKEERVQHAFMMKRRNFNNICKWGLRKVCAFWPTKSYSKNLKCSKKIALFMVPYFICLGVFVYVWKKFWISFSPGMCRKMLYCQKSYERLWRHLVVYMWTVKSIVKPNSKSFNQKIILNKICVTIKLNKNYFIKICWIRTGKPDSLSLK